MYYFEFSPMWIKFWFVAKTNHDHGTNYGTSTWYVLVHTQDCMCCCMCVQNVVKMHVVVVAVFFGWSSHQPTAPPTNADEEIKLLTKERVMMWWYSKHPKNILVCVFRGFKTTVRIIDLVIYTSLCNMMINSLDKFSSRFFFFPKSYSYCVSLIV